MKSPLNSPDMDATTDAPQLSRDKRIEQLLMTRFSAISDRAKTFFAIVEGAPYDDQVRYLGMVLSRYSTCVPQLTQGETTDSISDEMFQTAESRIGSAVKSWIAEIERNNYSLKEVARFLLGSKTLLGIEAGDERAVALGMVLSSKVVPYAKLPLGFMLVSPESDKDEAEMRISASGKTALIRRIFRDTAPLREVAVGLVNALKDVNEPIDRVAIVMEAFKLVRPNTSTRRTPSSMSDMLSMGIPGLLISIGEGEESDE